MASAVSAFDAVERGDDPPSIDDKTLLHVPAPVRKFASQCPLSIGDRPPKVNAVRRKPRSHYIRLLFG